MCFELGVGDAQKDFKKALSLYEKSSKLGFTPAMTNRAFLLYK
jgi:TPR repeat protein